MLLKSCVIHENIEFAKAIHRLFHNVFAPSRVSYVACGTKYFAAFGLNRPAIVRYGSWLGGIIRGDLGKSAINGVPVTQLIGQRLLNSLLLVAATLTLLAVLSRNRSNQMLRGPQWIKDLEESFAECPALPGAIDC